MSDDSELTNADRALATVRDSAIASAKADQPKTRLARFVQVTLYSHVLFTLAVSGFTGLFTLASLSELGTFNATSAAFGGLAAYGFITAAMMLVSAMKVGRRSVDGPTWTRVSLVTAIPGTLLTGAIALIVAVFAGAEGVVPVVAAAGAITLLAFLVLYALVRLLVKNDLDELVWEQAESGLIEAFPEHEIDPGEAQDRGL